MFRKAFAIASGYTQPVVLSRKTVAGACSSSIGAFVVINDEGWIATAGHILTQLQELQEQERAAIEHPKKAAEIRAQTDIDQKERSKRLQQLGKIGANSTERCSAWWGPFEGSVLVDAAVITAADFGIGRLEPFNKSVVKNYPVFKDPTKDFDPGTSLCKLGYPFHSITPIWHADKNAFELPPGAVPLPMFPIDGIFTRMGLIEGVGPNQKFPLQWVETSSPGLRGQSGGPIFDVLGTIWAVQCVTSHWPLGFNPPVPNGQPGQVEHQFLNVGMGVHPLTMFGLMDERKVKYRVSTY